MTTILEPGCYIDSHHGHYGIPGVIRLAVGFGYILGEFEAWALDGYDDHNSEDGYPFERIVELSERCEAWLNSIDACRELYQPSPPDRPEGFWWGWMEGDFGLWIEDAWDE